MTHKLILRVPVGMELSEEVLANLRADLGDFEIEYYTERHNLPDSYRRRQESLCNGVRQLLKTFPPSGRSADSIEEMLQSLCAQYRFPDFGLCGRYQDRLAAFTRALATETGAIEPWSGLLKECRGNPARLLDRAEQYALLEQDTPDIATIQRIDANGKTRLTVQYDRQLSALSPELERGFDAIRKHRGKAMPAWFQLLGKEIHTAWQEYICGTGTDVTGVAELMKRATNLKQVLDAAQNAGKLRQALTAIADKGLQDWPGELKALGAGERQLLVRLVQEKGAYPEAMFAQISKYNEHLNWIARRDPHVLAQELQRVREVPLEFYYMPKFEQDMLCKVLERGNPTSAPSRLRSINMTANLAEHHFQIRDEAGRKLEDAPLSIRFAHLASRDMVGTWGRQEMPKMLQERHALANLEHVLSLAGSPSVLLQTLISPIYTASITPDYDLDNMLHTVVQQMRARDASRELVFANHPFNIVKKFPRYWTPNDFPPGSALLDMVRARLTAGAVGAALQGSGEHGPGAQAIHALIGVQTAFINANWSTPGAWSLVRGLMPKLPPELAEYTPAEIDAMLSRAFVVASLRHGGQSSGSAASESAVQTALNDVISAHYGALKDLKQCKEMLAASLALAACEDKAQLMRLAPFAAHCANQAILANEYARTLTWKMLLVNAPFNDTVGRELMLASQEQLLMDGIGVPMGSCVSGKDRKGIVLVHTDAMRLYHNLYGTWPSSMDTGAVRENFVALVAELYVSRHAAAYAGLGAPGAEGIKTPWSYFPTDICEAIKKRLGNQAALAFDEVLATNNDVHHIRPRNFVEKMSAEVCNARAALLSSTGIRGFLATLMPALDRFVAAIKRTWTATFFGPPKGVISMQKTLSSSSGTDAQKLGAVYKDVMDRLGENLHSKLRDPATSELYDTVATLFESDTPDAVLGLTLSRLNNSSLSAQGAQMEPVSVPGDDLDDEFDSDAYYGSAASPSSSSFAPSSSSSPSSSSAWYPQPY